MEWVTSPEAWIALLTLTVLEIVLGIDNIIFISILSARVREEQRARARTLGLALAMFMRLGLLASVSWLAGLTRELFTVLGHAVTARDLVFIGGGLFLIYKATVEIHERLEGATHEVEVRKAATFGSVIMQIILLDIVFSLDSVITAVGMADHFAVMAAAVIIAVGIMMFAAGPVSRFVEKHPTVKMLALSFLLLIGVTLIADGLGQHIPKGYIYFAMGFSVMVEFFNLRAAAVRARRTEVSRQPVALHRRVPEE